MEVTPRLGTTTRRTRALRLIAALGVGLIFTSFIPGSAGGEEEFINGSGQSYAQIYRVGPTAGRLSLAPIFGLSLADYLNTVGRGEAKAADWAGIGVAECSLPNNTPTLKVSSNTPGAAEGISQTTVGSGGNGFVDLYARATKAPLGESRYRLATMSVPGLIEVRDSEAHTKAAIVDNAKGKIREATAETEIGTLVLAGGVVVLKGLRWTTTQQTGAAKAAKGTFTIDGATIGGLPLAIPAGDQELGSVIGPINAALAPTGFAISLPKVEERSGQANVSPLSFDIINSSLGRQFLAPVLEALHEPVRRPLTDAFIDLAKALTELDGPSPPCGAETDNPVPQIPDLTVGLLAADLTLGIASGSSQLHIELGGVSSYTEGELYENPFDDIDFDPPNLGNAPRTITTPGTAGTPGSPGTGPTEVEGEFASAPLGPGTKTIPGDKGGVAMMVGLIGLAVALGLGVADWLRMRASRRMEAGA